MFQVCKRILYIIGACQCWRGCSHLLQWQGFIQPFSGDDAQREEQDGRLQLPLLSHRTGEFISELIINCFLILLIIVKALKYTHSYSYPTNSPTILLFLNWTCFENRNDLHAKLSDETCKLNDQESCPQRSHVSPAIVLLVSSGTIPG